MEPRVSKRGRKLLINYELPHRIHCSTIYPTIASNGSTIILYGHTRGLRILWRGGRKPRDTHRLSARHAKTNGSTHDEDAMVIDDRDEDSNDEESDTDDSDEIHRDGNENLDYTFPSIIQDVDIDLDTEVLQIAVPPVHSSSLSQTPSLTRDHIIAALVCSNNKVLLLQSALDPPSNTAQAKEHYVRYGVSEIQLDAGNVIPTDLTLKLVPVTEDTKPSTRGRKEPKVEGRLVLAVAGKALHIWSFDVTSDALVQSEHSTRPVLRSHVSASSISWHPSPLSGQLLVVDHIAAVRIFECAFDKSTARSQSSQDVSSASYKAQGRYISSFLAPFHAQGSSTSLARRKKILDACWVLGGRGIFALLEDGEWGIWDATGSMTAGRSIQDLALHAYLATSSNTELAEAVKQRKSGSKLAPMTPDTRKAKANNLFSGVASKPAGMASSGGVSVTSASSRSGQLDESVIMWYNGTVYSIANVQSFWQRSTNSDGSFGSLYTPGLTQISDIDLMNETITSISHFSSAETANHLGQMNTQRDLLLSAEHRFVIVQNSRSQNTTQRLFQRELAERPALLDRKMLDAGELDLDGVNRMLENLTEEAKPRRVGFAR